MDSDTPGRNASSMPIPSDWDHAKTLMALSFRKDRKKPKLWALKIFLMPALLMLYTIGIFVNHQDNDSGSYVAGDYRLFKGEEWSYPSKIHMGAFNSIFLDQVATALLDRPIDIIQILNATSSNEVMTKCEGTIDDSASN